MKKYIKSFLVAFSFHIPLYAYLFTIGTLKIAEGGFFDSVILILLLSAISFLADFVILFVAGRFLMWLFKNKINENRFFAFILYAPAGFISLALQIFAGEYFFGVVSSMKPLAMLIFGWILILLSSFTFKFTITREKINTIFIGEGEQIKKMADYYLVTGVAKNLVDFKKLNKKYTANRYFLLDLSEADVAQIIKILTYQPATVTFLYSSQAEPEFNDRDLKKWEESHGFSVVKLSDAELSLSFQRLSRRFF